MSDVQFVNERERLVFARAVIGERVKDFLTSDVGRYLHGRARADLEQAQVDALECNVDTFWGRKKFRKIKEKGDIATNFMKYCADAIQDGEIAYQELRETTAKE